jgi:hypothetical protein
MGSRRSASRGGTDQEGGQHGNLGSNNRDFEVYVGNGA